MRPNCGAIVAACRDGKKPKIFERPVAIADASNATTQVDGVAPLAKPALVFAG
jgi:hypothetical protein